MTQVNFFRFFLMRSLPPQKLPLEFIQCNDNHTDDYCDDADDDDVSNSSKMCFFYNPIQTIYAVATP